MYKVTVPVICDRAYKYKEETLREIKRCKAERVAIVLYRELEYGGSSKETLTHLKDLIQFYKEEGVETLVWVGETLGHDRKSKPAAASEFTHIKYMDKGEVAAYCPLDEMFSDVIAEWLTQIAECGADFILLDDDFRMGLGFGCCCKHHMEVFEAELGEKVPVEELQEKLLKGGKNPYRDAWLKVQGEGMRRFATKMRNALNQVNPSIRLGACLTMGRWDADGADAIEIANILAGDTKPFIRTFGAPYHTTIGYLGNQIEEERYLANVVEKERAQFKWCENQDIEIIAEGDTYPRPRFACPASHLECFDMIMRADGQADGILKYMLDYVSSPEYETGYVDFMVENEALYSKITEMFVGKTSVGVRPYLHQHTIHSAELDYDKLDTPDRVDALAFQDGTPFYFLNANSIPSTYEEDSVKVVFGENGRYIPEEALSDGLILDIVAARLLQQRGIDVGIEEIEETGFFAAYEYYPENDEEVRLDATEIAIVKANPKAHILTQVTDGTEKKDFVFTYENDNAQRFLIFPFEVRSVKEKMGYFRNYLRRKQLINIMEWLAKKPLDVYVDGNYPMLYIMAKRDEAEMSVGLWNLFQDRCKDVRLNVADDFEVLEFVNCQGHQEGKSIVIDSIIFPYEFAGVKIALIQAGNSEICTI